MPDTTETDTPQNLAGRRFTPIESVEVAEWHPTPDGTGRPEQVHLLIHIPGLDCPLALRMKSGAAVDAIADALAEHRRNVFGPR